MRRLPIERYWDHCATTPLSEEVINAMSDSLRLDSANPSSTHRWGLSVRDRIEAARCQLASLLKVQARELFFTSGATEANQMSILSTAKRVKQPGHIITQVTEHSAVLEPIRILQSRGFDVSILEVDRQGLINLDQLSDELRTDTQLVSIMHINNELGTMQPIEAISELITRHGRPECLLHVDGAQSTGKLPLDLGALEVDLFSLSAHKFYGPKGIGALYVKRRSQRRPTLKLPPISFGGGQERGLRPGTLATHQIIGLGVAAELAERSLSKGDHLKLKERVDSLWNGIKSLDRTAIRRGTGEAPHVLSITVSTDMFSAIEDGWSHIAFSRGSACQSRSGKPSRILTAIGLNSEEASRTLRFGLGGTTSDEEIKENLDYLRAHLARVDKPSF